MANTFRVNWFKKLLNSCTPTRKYCSMDDTHAISSTMDMTILNGSRKESRLPEPTHLSIASRPVKFHKCPTATAVRVHPVIRNLNISNKQKRSLSLACQKRRRDEQLGKNLGSQASRVQPRPIPLKIVAMSKVEQARHPRMALQDFRDSVVVRNIERIVREMQAAKHRNRRSKREPPQEITVTVTASSRDKPMKGLGKKTVGLEKHLDKDIRFSRMRPNLEYNAKRAASSRSTDDPSCGNLPGRNAYHMRVTHVKFRFLIKRNHRKRSHDTTKIISKAKTKAQSIEPNPGTSKLVQEEQKRLDILRAEWMQLKGLENAAKNKNSLQTKELNMPRDSEPGTSTALDLNSLIVDPKSFLTKVHVKSQVFSVDFEDNVPEDSFELENPIDFPDPTKSNEFGDGSLPLVPQ